MTRSPYKTYAVTLVVVFLLTAAVLVVVMAVKQHTCLVETQADPLADLPVSRIPAHCASQFHRHIQASLILSGFVALLMAPAVAVWRIPARRQENLREA
jgi:hypothetical protein